MSCFHAGPRAAWHPQIGIAGPLASVLVLLASTPLIALQLGASTVGPANSVQQDPVTLTGVVLNASTRQPVARALVQVGEHAVLTEHDGNFQFTAASGSSELLRVTKPGYYAGPDQDGAAKRVTFSAGADPALNEVKVYLFPEGLITGTLTAPNGDPVPGVYVQALRKMGDESGSSWNVAGQALSNSEGEFRIPLSAGEYVIETHYMADQYVRRQAIMPTMAPDPANGSDPNGHSAVHLDSGAEVHLDLRPKLLPTRDVHIRIDGNFNQGFPQIEAHLPNGLSFFPVSRPSGTPGDFLLTMPTGSYLLTMYTGDRDGGGYAEASVTVGEQETGAVVMQIAKSLPVPVEVMVDSSSSSSPSSATSDNNPPSVQQLGLHFVRTTHAAPEVNNQTIYLRSGRGETPSFSLLPGSYRLLAQPMPQWFISSATVAGTDLLAHDLDVEAGETSAPLRIVVSNHTAAIKGTIKLDGTPDGNAWVYLIAATPGVVPVIPISSSPDGSFSRPSLPPGSYRAVAFETRRSQDFSDPATLDRLASYVKSITIAAGETGSLDLDAVPAVEPSH